MFSRKSSKGKAPDPPTICNTNDRNLSAGELRSTVEDILQFCPRFRILVLGRAGVGKSSLINAAFDVDLANVGDGVAGVSNIDDEIISPSNPRFVLHDSQGFATGEVRNFKMAHDFIQKRRNRSEIKDKLHAVWFCVQVPTEGGSLFEAGDEVFFKRDHTGVPIIVVFTQYDRLVSKIEQEVLDNSELRMEDDEMEVYIKAKADATFEELCAVPFKTATEGSVLVHYVKVSKFSQDTLEDLVKLTQKHLDEAVSLPWALAQRASIDLNIEASIQVGRSKYWRGLASNLNFAGSLKQYLDVVHKDIILVWNFHDPNMNLRSNEFKALMSRLVEDLADSDVPQTTRNISIGTITSVAGIVSGIIHPAAPVAIPIATGLILAQWVYKAYQATPNILCHLMAYVIDLTIVMQSIFWHMQARGGTDPVSIRLIKLAYNSYWISTDRSQVHTEIRTYVNGNNVFVTGRKDRVLEKVVELINGHHFKPQGIDRLGTLSGWADGTAEGWDVRATD